MTNAKLTKAKRQDENRATAPKCSISDFPDHDHTRVHMRGCTQALAAEHMQPDDEHCIHGALKALSHKPWCVWPQYREPSAYHRTEYPSPRGVASSSLHAFSPLIPQPTSALHVAFRVFKFGALRLNIGG
jgi:hypothetical protein